MSASSTRRVALGFVLSVAALCVVLYAGALPYGPVLAHPPDPPGRILLVPPFVSWTVGLLGVTLAVIGTLLVLRNRPPGIIRSMFIVWTFGAALAVGTTLSNEGTCQLLFGPRWEVLDRLPDEPRRDLVLLHGHRRPSKLALGVREDSTFGTEFDLYCTVWLHRLRYYSAIVYPRGNERKQRRHLQRLADGRMLLIADNRCYFVFEGETETLFLDRDLMDLSPFVLIDQGEEGSEADVQVLAATLRDLRARYGAERLQDLTFTKPIGAFAYPNDEDLVIPKDATLATSASAGNTWVRAAIERLVAAAGPDVYPETAAALAK